MNATNPTAGNGLTVAPLTPAANGANLQAEFLRLPKPGTLCGLSGLSRSYLNSLVLPTPDNGHRPPVKSVCLRKKGAKTGVRLICVDSLRAYLAQHIDGATQAEGNAR